MTDQARPRFDGTITLGNILTVFGFIVAAIAAYYAIRTELSTVSTRVERMETQLTSMSQVLISDARRGVEIEELRRRVNVIERKLEER